MNTASSNGTTRFMSIWFGKCVYLLLREGRGSVKLVN
jgi:hypothetical protein